MRNTRENKGTSLPVRQAGETLAPAGSKERPILFSTPMVQAILDGRKTQTRRIVTERRSGSCDTHHKSWLDFSKLMVYTPLWIRAKSKIDGTYHQIGNLYNVGDLLWVRETFSCFVQAGGSLQREKTKYKADERWNGNKLIKWKPSIFMPKAAARIWLKVVAVRVERLQDISEHGALEEGIDQDWLYYDYLKKEYAQLYPVNSFRTLWQSINGVESWKDNPWVWVVEFERTTKP